MKGVLRFPLLRNPWDNKDYLVLLDAPDYPQVPGLPVTNMLIIGISRDRKYVQFTVPMDVWKAVNKTVSFIKTDLTRQIVEAPKGPIVAGSKIQEPWRVAFPIINGFIGMYVRTYDSGTHYTVSGVMEDGRAVERIFPKHDFDAANANPTWFVEVDEAHAPVARAPDASPVQP